MHLLLPFMLTVVVLTITPGFSSVFEMPKYLIFIFTATVYLLLSQVRKSSRPVRLRQVPLLKPVGVFALLIVVSNLLNAGASSLVYISPRFFETPLFFVIVASLYGVAYTRSTRAVITNLNISLLLAGAVVGMYAAAQRAGLDPFTWSEGIFSLDRSFSTLGNPILLATFCAMVLPIAVVLSCQASSLALRVVYLAAGVLLVSAAHFSGSRAGMAAALVGVTVLMLFTIRVNRSKLRSLAAAAVAIIAISIPMIGLIAAADGVRDATPDVADRLSAAFTANDPSGSSRLFVWKSSVEMIKDRPLFGYSARGFTNFWPSYRDPEQFEIEREIRYYDHPHNLYIELAVMYGIPAILAFLTLLVCIGLRAWRSMIAMRANSTAGQEDRLLIGAAAFSGIAAFTFSVTFSFSSVTLWLTFFMLVLVFAKSSDADVAQQMSGEEPDDSSHTQASPINIQRSGFMLTSILLMILVSIFVWRSATADVSYKKGQSLLVQDPFSSIEQMDKAVARNPLMPDYRIGLASALLRSAQITELQARASNGQGSDKKINADVAQSIEVLRSSGRDMLYEEIEQGEREYLAYFPLVDDLIETGELDKAQFLVDELLKFDDLNFRAIYFMGYIKEKRGSTDAALKDYERAYQLQHQDITPVKRSAIIYILKKDWNKAKEMLQIVLSATPDDRLAIRYMQFVEKNLGSPNE